ncbi:MAG: hypothetical protein Q9222_003016 [Ikaeria aurantiellina]
MNGHSYSKPLINFLRGWPNPSLLPAASLKRASAIALSNPDISIPGLEYGPDPGYEPLRESIAGWLSRFYSLSIPVNPNRICITGGASQNMACLLQVFSDPLLTKHIWMVSPTYFMICPIFEDNAFHGRLRSIPEDDEGIDVDYLRQKICESEEKIMLNEVTKTSLKGSRPWRKIYSHIIYAVPTFSNPSSRTMTLRRRQQLVQVAREFNALIITDDVYDQLQWSAHESSHPPTLHHAVLPRLADIDRKLDGGAEREGADGFGNAVSNGSFSKIVGPGVRCGWAEGTSKFTYALSQCGSSASGGAPSQTTSTFLTHMLKSGELEDHIFTTLQPTYARRYYSMMKAIERHLLPLGVTMPQSDRAVVGGYFLWLSLPKPLLADEVARQAKEEENLTIGPGSLFGVYGDERKEDLDRQVRLCFSWEEEDNLIKGMERLAAVIRRMQSQYADSPVKAPA